MFKGITHKTYKKCLLLFHTFYMFKWLIWKLTIDYLALDHILELLTIEPSTLQKSCMKEGGTIAEFSWYD